VEFLEFFGRYPFVDLFHGGFSSRRFSEDDDPCVVDAVVPPSLAPRVPSDAGPRKAQLVASHDTNDGRIRRRGRVVGGSLVVIIFEGGRKPRMVVGLEGNGLARALLLPCVRAGVIFVAVAVTAFHSTVAVAFVRSIVATTVITVTVALDKFVRSNVLVLDIIARGVLVLGACNGILLRLRLRLADGVSLIGGSATHGRVLYCV